jgi:hypothetical protein
MTKATEITDASWHATRPARAGTTYETDGGATSATSIAKVLKWRNRDLNVIAGDVFFRKLPKLTSRAAIGALSGRCAKLDSIDGDGAVDQRKEDPRLKGQSLLPDRRQAGLAAASRIAPSPRPLKSHGATAARSPWSPQKRPASLGSNNGRSTIGSRDSRGSPHGHGSQKPNAATLPWLAIARTGTAA